MPPIPLSTLRNCTNCTALQHALTKDMPPRDVENSNLILFFCGIAAAVTAAGAGVARLSNFLYTRLNAQRRSPTERRAKHVRFAEVIENDTGMGGPLVTGPYGNNRNYVWYAETDKEGLGIQFRDMREDSADRDDCQNGM
ncbi:MAG: hypothetical protein LQ345_003982 [Seirophora villosa]|nr:MAG: hypothetical protein LQ345_003982 [Seirophora villosa]